MIAQDASLVPFLSARENVEVGLQVRTAKGNAAETLASVGLVEPPSSGSTGSRWASDSA